MFTEINRAQSEKPNGRNWTSTSNLAVSNNDKETPGEFKANPNFELKFL